MKKYIEYCNFDQTPSFTTKKHLLRYIGEEKLSKLDDEIIKKLIDEIDVNDETLKYMTSTVDCTDEFAKVSPAVVHIDGTARPQIVTKQTNAMMYKLILKWHKLTKELSLINTSFNYHEQPIVCLLNDALLELKKSTVDVVYSENQRFSF